jgi:hypothetical protein
MLYVYSYYLNTNVMCTTSMFKQYPTFVFRQYELIKQMTMIANHGLKKLWWGTFPTRKGLPRTPKQILFQVTNRPNYKMKIFHDIKLYNNAN